MRWDLFDNAVKQARKYVQDEDAARDVAVQALEEVGSAPDAYVMQCVKRRAQDAVKAYRRQPLTTGADMDLLPASDNVFEEVAEREAEAQLEAAIGTGPAHYLRAKAAGLTNAELALALGVSEETVRLRVAAAELARDISRGN